MANAQSKTPLDQRDEWRTPPWLFAWLDARFKFDIDLAATKENSLVPRAYFTDEYSALEFSWACYGACGFLNPPYSAIDPWITKAIDELAHGFTTVMLIPSPNGEERWEHVFRTAAEVVDIIGRIAFLTPDGEPIGGNPRGSSVVVWTPGMQGCARRWANRRWIEKTYSGRSRNA